MRTPPSPVRLASPVAKINTLPIHRLPAGRALRVTKVIKADGVLLILAENGNVYSDSIKDRRFYMLAMWRFTPGVLKGLHGLGVITKKDVEAHMDEVRKQVERTKRQEMVNDLFRAARRLDVVFNDQQRKVLRRYVKANHLQPI